MKQLFYLTVLLLLFSCKKESINIIDGYCNDLNYSYLEKSLEKDNLFKDPKISYKIGKRLQRELIDGYIEEIIFHTKSVQSEENKYISSIYEHVIKLIHKEDKIVLYKLFKKKNVKMNDKWVETDSLVSKRTDQVLTKDLLKKYKALYNSELKLSSLFETNIIYGSNCGIVGIDPVHRFELNKIIKAKDKEKLKIWLKSSTVELQLYAIEGIYVLENIGVKFSPNVYKLVQSVENKKGYANTCYGCSYSDSHISNLVRKIKKEHNKANI